MINVAVSGAAGRAAGRPERRGGRQRARADPLRATARPRGAPGGALRRARPDALDPTRLDFPGVVHARRAAGDPASGLPRRVADDRAREPAVAQTPHRSRPTFGPPVTDS